MLIEKFVLIDKSSFSWRWIVDLEATGLDPKGQVRRRALVRVCCNSNNTVRMIAAESDEPMGRTGAPVGDNRVFADMTQQEAWSLGMALIRAAIEKEPPDGHDS